MNKYVPHMIPLGYALDTLKLRQSMRMLVEEYPYNRAVLGYISCFFNDRKSDKKFKVKFLNRDQGYTILRIK